MPPSFDTYSNPNSSQTTCKLISSLLTSWFLNMSYFLEYCVDYSLEVLNDSKLNYSSRDTVYINYKQITLFTVFTWMYVTTPISAFRMSAAIIPPLVTVDVAALQVECKIWLLKQPFCSAYISAVTDIASLDLHTWMVLEPTHLKGTTPPSETPQFNSLLWKGNTKNGQKPIKQFTNL